MAFRSDDAPALIHQVSRGLPRAVNNLALQGWVAAYAAKQGHRRQNLRSRR